MDSLLSKPKNRKVAVILALVGAVTPIAGLHKFYMKQPWWGAFYLLLCFTPIPRVACAIEALWYLAQDSNEFDRRFNHGIIPTAKTTPTVEPSQVGAVAQAMRELDRLRDEGLLSEYEFEQKRRNLLDKIA